MATWAVQQALYEESRALIAENGQLMQALVNQVLDEKDAIIAEQAALLRDAREVVENAIILDGHGYDSNEFQCRVCSSDPCPYIDLLERLPK